MTTAWKSCLLKKISAFFVSRWLLAALWVLTKLVHSRKDVGIKLALEDPVRDWAIYIRFYKLYIGFYMFYEVGIGFILAFICFI